MAPVRAEKKESTFSKFKIWFVLKKSHFKGIFDLKTVNFVYKPISDGLF